MTAVERKLLTDYLDETGNRVLDETVRRFSPEQLTFNPEPGGWSIAQNVEHLSVVERLVLKEIQHLIDTPEAAKQSAWSGRDNDLLSEARRRTPTLEAPEIIQPQVGSNRAVIFREFERAHHCLIEFAETTEAELRLFCFAHPIYGELDCYQWLLLSGGAHCERHLAQIHDLIGRVNFPKGTP
jgi:DinB superfamily